MRSLFCIFVLIVPTLLFASSNSVTLTVAPTATVSGDTVYVSDVSEIKGAGKDMTAKLNAVPLGRAPLDGLTRTLTVGNISLKLRQAGFNPDTVTFAGASSVTISLGNSSSGSAQAPDPSGNANTPSSNSNPPSTSQKPAVRPIVIHSGDTITAVYEDGPVSISVQATAESAGCIGDLITLRTAVSGRSLKGQIVDSETVALKN